MSGSPPEHERFARDALRRYGRPADSTLRLLGLPENTTFLAGEHEDPLVLRIHRPGYHSLPAIRSELAWMTALRAQTPVATPAVVPALDGSEVVVVQVGDTARNVAAMTFIPGDTAERNPDEVGFDQLGRITAVMHHHSRTWTPPAGFTRFRWDLDSTLGRDARWGDWRRGPGLTDIDRDWIQRAADDITERLTRYGTGPANFGLVHGDLRLANLMVDPAVRGGPITVIDFDDCGWSWYLADLGAAVSFIEDTPTGERIIADWLRGYREVTTVSDEELLLIPCFVMLRRIMLTAWVASHPDADSALGAGANFAPNTARLAQRYLCDLNWLQNCIFGSHV